MKTKYTATVQDADTQPMQPRKGRDWAAKIVCLFIAFVIWFYVMQVDSPEHEETFRSVDVTLTNTSLLEDAHGLSVYSGYGTTVDITVIGKKSDINKLTADDFTVIADVSVIDAAGLHSVPVHVDLPTGLSLESVSQNNIQVYADEKSSTVVEVRARITSIMTGSQLEVGEPRPRHETVVVTGPKSALDTIDHAEITLALGNVSASMTASGPLLLVDKNGSPIENPYLRLSRTEVTVDVPVYTTKTLPVVVAYKYGYFNETNVNITADPAEITLRGDPATLEKMTEIVITTLDEKKITGNVTQKVELYLTDGLTAVDGTQSVTVNVSHVGTHTKTFTVTDIDVTGAVGVNCEILTQSLSVTVRGTLAQLALLKSSDFSAVVDMSGYTADSTGNITKTAIIRIDSAYADGIYEIGEYAVQVRLN